MTSNSVFSPMYRPMSMRPDMSDNALRQVRVRRSFSRCAFSHVRLGLSPASLQASLLSLPCPRLRHVRCNSFNFSRELPTDVSVTETRSIRCRYRVLKPDPIRIQRAARSFYRQPGSIINYRSMDITTAHPAPLYFSLAIRFAMQPARRYRK